MKLAALFVAVVVLELAVITTAATCPPTNHCADCDAASGACVGSCFGGYWDANCSSVCYTVNCSSNSCLQDNGTCVDCDSAHCGPSCNQSCHCAVAADRKTGVCSAGCQKGFWGSMCDSICKTQNCSTNVCLQDNGNCVDCDSVHCGPSCDQPCHCAVAADRKTGVCSSGCNQGFWGSTCNGVCNTANCSSYACIQDNGTCIDCDSAHCGPSCDQPCHCAIATDRKTGVCSSGCQQGFWDSTCNGICNTQNCSSYSCLQDNGTCVDCDAVHCGPLCDQPCHCSVPTERRTGVCPGGCASGFWGTVCSRICYTTNCSGYDCFQDNGTCPTCDAAHCGPLCDQPCHCAISADRKTGACPGGCAAGYWGAMCNASCATQNCTLSSCDQTTGLCSDCDSQHCGLACDKQCHCTMPADRKAGVCVSACNAGWWSAGDNLCTEPCPAACAQSCFASNGSCPCPLGMWGASCEHTCINCSPLGCNMQNGTCFECVSGYKGTKCNDKCSKNCAQGCLRNGACVGGCSSRWYCGDKCSHFCTWLVVLWAVLGLLAVAGVVAVVLFVLARWRVSQNAQSSSQWEPVAEDGGTTTPYVPLLERPTSA